jgi:cell division protein FtsQ
MSATAAPRSAGILLGRYDASALLPSLPRRRRFKLLNSHSTVSVPLEHRLPRGLGMWLTVVFFGVIGVSGVVLGDHISQFRASYGEPRHALARAAGFGISRVTISGIAELHESEILAGAGVGPKISLVFLDAAAARRQLEAMPLVSDAAVRKLYPNELTITVAERKPAALWQRHGEVFVVAADGTVIDQMRDQRFLRLPFVVGENANARLKDYVALLEAAGPLRSRIRAGILVSDRHWDLKLDNGVDIRLPERSAAEALQRFAALERERRLSDKDIISVDMRIADRVVLRLTEEAGAARAEANKKKPKAAKGAEI